MGIYFLYIIFGVLPSIIWLLFYLRKDIHPEPKLLVLKVFFYGMLAALPAVFIERGFFEVSKETLLSPFLISIMNTFLGVATTEEVLKYLVVRGKVLKSPEFDEPIDAMIYMIIAALGFAASENILILLQFGPMLLLSQTIFVFALRFLGATFLHALCSATVGFFLARSIARYQTEKFRLIGAGLVIAISLHGLFNFFIIKGGAGILIPVIILASLALFVSLKIQRLTKIKNIYSI